MNNSHQIYRCLEDVFKYKEFKSVVQKNAVYAVLNGKKDVFVSMPTGAGKSLVYQLPAVFSDGVTIVVSPLLALIHDQVESLKALGICVATYNSNIHLNERLEIKCNLLKRTPSIKLLYVTPELIETAEFNRILQQMHENGNLTHIAVDEAHCVSQWGHDFRPAYLKLGILRDKYPAIKWIALTATATPRVQQDIVQLLNFKEPVEVFKIGCYRPNLFYDVRFKELLDGPYDDLVDFVNSVLKKDECNRPSISTDCGIIYCHTKENCESMAVKLSGSGIKTKAYHAGLSSKVRNDIQQEWMNGVISVIAATVSFGMGVDKSSVRFVVHWKIPQSVERYYQESGRAGRDGKKSYCRLYYSRYEKEQILFLLRKDLGSKKKGDRLTKEKASLKSFKALVEYSEGARCRHAFMSEYFGDEKPECNNGCDFCRKPKEVEELIEQLRGGVFANKGHHGYTKTYMCSDFGQVDKDLYGGGRYGDDTRYSDDENKAESNYEKKCKKYRNKLVQDEFKKRSSKRKNSDVDDFENIPGLSCRIKDASDVTHIPKLAVKVREFCFERLQNSLMKNYELNNRSTVCVERLAENLEYDIFRANRSSQKYKLSIGHKVKEINQSTDRNEIFSGGDSISKSPVQSNEESEIESKFKRGQFVKASDLLLSNDESIPEIRFNRNQRVNASDLLNNDESDIETETTSKVLPVKLQETICIDLTSENENNDESEIESETTLELLPVKQETIYIDSTSENEIEKTAPDDMDINCLPVSDTEQRDKSDEEPGRAGADTTEKSFVTISSSTIKPLQGSLSGNSSKASVLQTLKRPSISKDVQKIIAKREKHPPKSQYDIPSLPPLPSLTDSYIETTFTTEKPDFVSSKEIKHEPQSKSPIQSQGSSTMSPGLLIKNEHPISSVWQESSKNLSQVTTSNVQPTSAILSASSTCFQNIRTVPQTISLLNSVQATYTTTQSTYGNDSNVKNIGVQPGHDASSVFSLGTSSSDMHTTSFQDMIQCNTSDIGTNYSSGISANYTASIHQGVHVTQAARAHIPPQFSASYPQVAQPVPNRASVPMDPRLYHGTNQSQTGSMVTPSSVYFQHNHSSPAPINVNQGTTPEMQQVHLPVSGVNAHLTSDISKETSNKETENSHSRSTENKVEKSKTNKKDCADIIVRYLTPYYRSGEVESKSSFKTLAKEMTERLVQTMGDVSDDKLRNTARSLVKVYFDEKRRKSSKAK